MLGSELKEIRNGQLKLKQVEMARALGIVQDTLCRWEKKNEKEAIPLVYALAVEALLRDPGRVELARSPKQVRGPRVRKAKAATEEREGMAEERAGKVVPEEDRDQSVAAPVDQVRNARAKMRAAFAQSKRAAGVLSEKTGIEKERLIRFAHGAEVTGGEWKALLEVLEESEGSQA